MKKNILFIALLLLLTSCGDEKVEKGTIVEKPTTIIEKNISENTPSGTDIEKEQILDKDSGVTNISEKKVDGDSVDEKNEIKESEKKTKTAEVIDVKIKTTEVKDVKSEQKVENNIVGGSEDSQIKSEKEETTTISKEESDKLFDDLIAEIDSFFKDN